MKITKFALSIAVAALFLVSGAVAGENNKATLHISDKVSLDGKVLAPGTYKLQWEGNGPSVQVTVLKDKETVGTFSAHRSELAAASRANAIEIDKGSDGTPVLKTIYLGGKKYSLQVEQTQATQQTNP